MCVGVHVYISVGVHVCEVCMCVDMHVCRCACV